MKARYSTHNGRITFEVEGETVKAIFPLLASIQEVFDAEHECGMCHSSDIRYQARKVDDFDFYELACNKCRARFSFGQAKKGGALFPKRRDEDGKKLDHGGWSRYEPPGSPPAHAAEPAERKPEAGTTAGLDSLLQPSFDRLGVLFSKPAPTRITAALDLIRDEMNEIAGNTGTAEFDRIYRRFEAPGTERSVATYKLLLRDLVGAHEKLSLGVNA